MTTSRALVSFLGSTLVCGVALSLAGCGCCDSDKRTGGIGPTPSPTANVPIVAESAPGLEFVTRGRFDDAGLEPVAGTLVAAVDPSNPRHLAVASTLADGRLLVATSGDGASTWARRVVDAAVDAQADAVRTSPRVAYDRFGNLYVAYLASAPGAAPTLPLLQSRTNGAQFETRLLIPRPDGAQSPLLATGPAGVGTGDAIYVGWTEPGRGLVVAATSCAGLGAPLSTPTPSTACMDVVPSEASAASAAVGRDGTLYVTWADAAIDPSLPSVVRMDRAPHGLLAGGAFGADVVVALASAADDPRLAVLRTGPTTERVAVAFTAAGPAGGADTDAFLAWSDDVATGFSSSHLVNADLTGRAQRLVALGADDLATGTLVAVWSGAPDVSSEDTRVAVHVGVSYDAGLTFTRSVAFASPPGTPGPSSIGLGLASGTALLAWDDAPLSTPIVR